MKKVNNKSNFSVKRNSFLNINYKKSKYTIITLIFAFFLMFSALAERSLVTVPLIKKPPTIDGKIWEEEEWYNSTRITNFIDASKGTFAKEQTIAWLCYDRENLYVALKLKATVLEHAAQMRSRFLAECTGKKGEPKRVWHDDHIQLRILPPWEADNKSRTADYQLMINANAQRVAWGPGGGGWIRGISAAGTIDDGFWTLEIKIPLSSLNRKKTLIDQRSQELSDWKFNIIRFEKHSGEVSSIENIVGIKYNNSEGFARLNFATNDSIPALQTPEVVSGLITKLPVKIFSQNPIAGEWNSIIKFHSSKEEFNKKFYATSGKSEFIIENNLTKPGQYNWHYSVNIGGKPIYRSPDYIMQSELRLAELTLLDYKTVSEVIFNSKNLIPQNISTLNPRSGINELILTSKLPKIRLKLDAAKPDIPMPAGRWEYQAGKEWKPAVINENDGFITISAPMATRFRTVFYENATVFTFPGESPEALYLPDGGTCGVLWHPAKIPGLNMQEGEKNVILNLWVPEWLELVGASSRQNDESSPWHALMMRLPKARRMMRHENFYKVSDTNGHYTISADELKTIDPAYETVPIRTDIRTRCMIALRAKPNNEGKRGRVRYMLTINGKPELPSGFDVEVLPQLNGIQPKNAKLAIYLSHFARLNSPEIMDSVYNTIRQAGANEVFIENTYVDPSKCNLEQLNFFNMRAPAQNASEMDIRKLIKAHPGARSTAGWLNFSYLARNPEVWDYVDNEFAAIKKRSPYLKRCFLDYEDRPFGHYADLSPYTLNIFAKEHDIKEPLNRDVIQKKYLMEWVKFRSRELGKVVGKFRKLANKHGFVFTMYLSPNPEVSLPHYSIDLKDVVNGIDFAYLGGSWSADTTKRTRLLCRNAGIKFATSVHVCKNQNTNWKRAIILRRLILSDGGGILFWYEKGFDGLMYQEIAHVTKLFSPFEDFFQKGKASAFASPDGKITFSRDNQTPLDIQDKMLGDVISETAGLVVYELSDRYLALAINDTDKPVSLELTLPGEATNFYTKNKHKGSIKISIKPYEYAAFHGTLNGDKK